MGTSSQSTINSATESVLAVGGYTKNAETLSATGWSLVTPGTLPVTVNGHCSAVVNATATIMIGGYQNNLVSGNSYILSNSSGTWTAGPKLITKRVYHTCAKIITNKTANVYGVIVVGGNTGKISIASVEVLKKGATAFVLGKALPVGMFYSSLFEDPSGGVILLNGVTDTGLTFCISQ